MPRLQDRIVAITPHSFPPRPYGFFQLAVFTVECLRVSLIFRLVHPAATGPAILRHALGVGDRRSILVLRVMILGKRYGRHNHLSKGKPIPDEIPILHGLAVRQCDVEHLVCNVGECGSDRRSGNQSAQHQAQHVLAHVIKRGGIVSLCRLALESKDIRQDIVYRAGEHLRDGVHFRTDLAQL